MATNRRPTIKAVIHSAVRRARDMAPVFGPVAAVSLLMASCYVAHEQLFFPAGAGLELDMKALPWAPAPGKPVPWMSAALRDQPVRLLWGLSLLVQTAVFVGAIGVFVHGTWRALRQAASNVLATLLTGVVVVLAAGIWLVVFLKGRWHVAAGPAGSDVVTRLVAKSMELKGTAALGVVVDVENGLVAALIFVGAIAIGAVLLPGGAAARPRSDRAALIRTLDQLRWLLNVAAGVLVAGVVQIGLEYHWVATLFQDAAGPDKAWEPGAAMASAVTLAAGVLFSLILAAAFVPAALTLRRRVVAYNRTAAPSETIDFDLGELYWGVAKIAGPVLAAGPLAYLFKP